MKLVRQMRQVLKEVYQLLKATITAFGNNLWNFFDDMPVMSHEAQRIFADSEDRKLYMDAVDKLRNGSKEETITLHTGETITLLWT